MTKGLDIDSSAIGAKYRDSLLKIVASSHSCWEIFDRIVEVLGRTIRFDRCEMSRLQPDATVKILQVKCSYPTQFLKAGRILPLGDDQVQAILKGQAIFAGNLLEKAGSVSPDLLAEGIRSTLAMPIHFRGQAIGVLALGSRAVGAFDEEDGPPVEAAAQLLGMVLAHQDLADHLEEVVSSRTSRLEEDLKDSEALLQTSALLLDREDPRTTFQRLAKVLRERLGYSRCEILLWDERSNHLVLEASTSAGQAVSPVTIPLGQGIAGIAAAERVPLRIKQVERDTRHVPKDPETNSQMAVPMLAAERLLGVISVESQHPDAFSNRDLELLRSIARQTALWMENRLLLAERERAEREAHASAAELKAALGDLRESQAQLVQAEKMAAVGTLVAGAAHELNNPLTVVQGYSELLLSQGLAATTHDRIRLIHEQARLAAQIVDGLLQMSRVALNAAAPEPAAYASEDAGHEPSRRQTCDLAEAVQEAVAECAPDLNQYSIILKLGLDPDLFVWIDPPELRKVIRNIVMNAQYALQGSLRKEITIETRRAGDRAELSIADTGPGLAPEVLTQIFDPFFTTKPVGTGAGLGLSICYGVVSSNGGSMEATNLPGGGAKFTVRLPALPDKQNPQVSAGTVLVIAAEEVTRVLWQDTLSEENCEVVLVSTCAEAMDLLARQPNFGLVMADLRAPHIEGLALHQEMGRRGLLVPLVLVTGETLEPSARATLTQTGCPLLSKPFRLKDLRRVLEEALVR